MRIPNLRKKIIINFSLSVVLLLMLGAVIFFSFSHEGTLRQEIDHINNEANRIRNETVALESKTAEIKKYKEIWRSLPENKKNILGIKIDDFNAKLDSTAEKYAITSLNTKIAIPEPLKESLFKRDTVEITFTTVNISFNALNDLKALNFINEFLQSLQGYPIVTSFELKKTKSYDTQELENIAAGKALGVVSGKIDFFWYVYKESAPK